VQADQREGECESCAPLTPAACVECKKEGDPKPPLSDRLKNVDWDDVRAHYEEEAEA
jgi:hypothetical protein